MIRPYLFTLVLLVGLAGSATAQAMSCSVTFVTGVAFGAYDVFSASPVDSVGSIAYECVGVGPSDAVAIELSLGDGAGFSSRRLVQGTHSLEYDLYVDAARTTVWGNGTSGTSRYQQIVPAEGSPTSVPVYGRIPAGQNAAVGVYSDTVIATIVF
jgi:spore coat protein U-like protein